MSTPPLSPQDHPRIRPARPAWRQRLARFFWFWLLLVIGSVLLSLVAHSSGGDRDAGWPATGLAPDPSTFRPPVLQVYAARTLGAKRAVSVHTWISVKRAGASEYARYEVIGWRFRRGRSPLVRRDGRPDAPWFGNAPVLLADFRGDGVEALIDRVEAAIAAYPFHDTYTLWPGPNSNTFTAYVGRAVPELGLDLPATAIGKDYRPLAHSLGWSPSGSGVQASLWGLLGLTLGLEEGLELNFLSLNIELDLFDLALELPGLGRLGPPQVASKPVEADLLTRSLSVP